LDFADWAISPTAVRLTLRRRTSSDETIAATPVAAHCRAAAQCLRRVGRAIEDISFSGFEIEGGTGTTADDRRVGRYLSVAQRVSCPKKPG
jgi:hypothetical protein